MTERTFSIIKPDAVERHLIGAILGRFESQGFRVVALKMVQLTKEQAEGFYAEHQGKPFFDPLVVEDGKLTQPVNEMNVTGNMVTLWPDSSFCIGKRKCRERLPHFDWRNESGGSGRRYYP